MATMTRQQRPVSAPARQDPDRAARRRAALVGAIDGFGVPVWFWLTLALLGETDTPPPGAPAQDFLTHYVDNLAGLPVSAGVWIGMWALLLVLVVAVVRAAVTRLDLAAVLAVALASAATAGTVMAEGVLVWPAFTYVGDPGLLAADLDPSVAKAMVLSRDGLHAPSLSLLGLALLLVAALIRRSDLWGRRTMTAVTAVVGVFSAAYVVLGPESIGAMLTIPWGIAMGVVLLVDRARR